MTDSHPSHEEKVEKLDALVRKIGIGMFVTTDDDSPRLYSRPIAFQDGLEDGRLYFFTYRDSDKVDEFRADRQVNIAFADNSSSNYISVSGTARIVADRGLKERKWSEALRPWFPQGLEQEGLALVEVRCSHAQYWDSKNQIFLHVYGYVKARLTGESVKRPGENELIEFPQHV